MLCEVCGKLCGVDNLFFSIIAKTNARKKKILETLQIKSNLRKSNSCKVWVLF